MSVNLPNKAARDSALVQSSTNRCSNFHKGGADTTASAIGNGTGTVTGRPLPRRAVRDMMPAE